MKFRLMSLTAFAAVAVSFAACKKETTTPTTQTGSINRSTARMTSVDFPENTTSFSDLVTSSTDAEDETVNKVLLHLSAGLREVMKNPTYSLWINQQLEAQESNEISFSQLFQQFPAAKTLVENTQDPLGQLTATPFAALESQLHHAGYNYAPSIHLANPGGINVNEPAIILAGLEVDDQEGLDDAYFGWQLDLTGSVSQVNVSEALAFSTTGPVISMSLMPLGVDVRPGATQAGTKQTGTPTGGYEMLQLIINDRYERYGKSEYTIAGKLFDDNVNAWTNYIPDSKSLPIYDVKKVVHLVPSWKIGQIVYPDNVNNRFFTFASYTGLSAFFNTYERDWAYGAQDLGQVTINGQTMTLRGNRKYFEEWYGFNPTNFSNGNSFNFALFNQGNLTDAYVNSKSWLKMQYVP